MPQQATKSDKHTLIEQGTEFKGTMKSSCPVVVNGRIEGELSAPELEITTTGVVQGNIKAERLSSRGKLSGNIDAGDLFLSGSVGSKTVIKAKNLEVKLMPEQGRMELTFGECTLDIGDEPTKERRAEPSLKSVPAPTPSLAHQLPVTKSNPPAPLLNKDLNESSDVAAASLSVVSDNSASASTPTDAGTEPKDGTAFGKDANDTKSNKSSAGGFSLSKPPQAKKAGARDSVPPGK
jgi:bactofilin